MVEQRNRLKAARQAGAQVFEIEESFGWAGRLTGQGVAIVERLHGPRVAGWLAAMCVSPVIGAAVAGAFPVPAAAEPVLLALAAGIIAQAAWVSLRAAFHCPRTSRLLLSPTAATTMAAIVTALAVHTAG